MALQRVKIGQVEKPIFIEKLKGDVNSEQFISIISDDAIPVGIIYVDDFKQSFYIDDLQQDPHLFESLLVSCGRPRRLYVMPCVKYNVWQSQDGQKHYGGPLSLFYLGVTEFDYKSKISPIVEDLATNGRTISTIDLRVKTIEKGDFTEMTFHPVISGNCAWRSDNAMIADVREKLNAFDSLIEMSIATRIDAATFAKRWYEKHPLTAETAQPTPQAYAPQAMPQLAAAPQAMPQLAVAPQATHQMAAAPQAKPYLSEAPQGYNQQAYAAQASQRVAPAAQAIPQAPAGYSVAAIRANQEPIQVAEGAEVVATTSAEDIQISPAEAGEIWKELR